MTSPSMQQLVSELTESKEDAVCFTYICLRIQHIMQIFAVRTKYLKT